VVPQYGCVFISRRRSNYTVWCNGLGGMLGMGLKMNYRSICLVLVTDSCYQNVGHHPMFIKARSGLLIELWDLSGMVHNEL